MTAQWDAINWFGRGNELHNPKSFGREGSKAWALSMVGHFSLSPPRFAFLAWDDYACSRFAPSTMGTTFSLFIFFLSFTEINQWTCLNSISTLSNGSQMLKHVLNYRPLYPYLLFSREQNFPINVAILEATEWCQRDLSLKFHIMPLGNVILK